jgi:hypothetical protein
MLYKNAESTAIELHEAAFGKYKRTGKKAVVAYFKALPNIRLNGLEDTRKNLSIVGVSGCSV